jgi:hypothetical protein
LTSDGSLGSGVTLELKTGWNMVSVPLDLPDGEDTVAAVFGDEIVAIYTWNPGNKSYEVPLTIAPEVGYWVAVTEDKTIIVIGTPKTTWEDHPLIAGWNMVGSVCGNPVLVADLVDDPTPSIVRSAIYWWDPEGKSYVAAASIVQGQGYWMAVTQNCTLTMTAPPPPGPI